MLNYTPEVTPMNAFSKKTIDAIEAKYTEFDANLLMTDAGYKLVYAWLVTKFTDAVVEKQIFLSEDLISKIAVMHTPLISEFIQLITAKAEDPNADPYALLDQQTELFGDILDGMESMQGDYFDVLLVI